MTDRPVEGVQIGSGLTIQRRRGPRPDTTDASPGTNIAQQQVSDTSPQHLQEELYRRVMALPHVTPGPSRISVPGARAFLLDPAKYQAEQFVGNEFGHIHPAYDGSRHLMMTPALVERINESQWGEPHPRAPMVSLVYGPRDEEELEAVWSLVEFAYRYASGEVDDSAVA